MKTVVDYLKEHGKYEHDVMGRAFEIELQGERILLGCDGEWVLINAEQKGWIIESDIADILEGHHIEIRFCEECGKPFDAGGQQRHQLLRLWRKTLHARLLHLSRRLLLARISL